MKKIFRKMGLVIFVVITLSLYNLSLTTNTLALSSESDKSSQKDSTILNTTSESLFDFDYGVTYKPDSDANWGKEAAAQEVVTVYTFAELNSAILNGTADYIKLGNDIVSDTLGIGIIRRNAPSNRRDYVIDGQGFKLDTGAVSWSYPDGATPHNFYIKNIHMYSQNPYGCFMGAELNYNFTTMVFEDTTYEGSQLTASWTTTLYFRGTNNVISRANQYTVTYSNGNNAGNNNTVTRSTYPNQSGLEAYRVIFDDNTVFNCTVENGDGLLIGSYLAAVPTSSGRTIPYVAVRSKATVNMVSQGSSGETWGYYTSNGNYYAGINIQKGGKLYVGADSTLTMDIRNTSRTGIFLGGGSASQRTNLTIDNGGTLNLLADGNRNTTESKYAGIKLYQYSDLNILAGGTLKATIDNDASGRPAVELAEYSTVTVGSDNAQFIDDSTPQGLLDLTASATSGSALNLKANSSFTVKDYGKASFVGTEQATATSDFVAVNGSLLIGNRGMFTAALTEEAGQKATGVRNLINAPATTSTFKFSDAYRVDLDARGNPNATLVSMGTSSVDGTFTADIQSVYQWNSGNSSAGDDTYDKSWIPIYNANITYRQTTIRTKTANSSQQSIANSFMSTNDGYDTQNSERILYEWIPDVTIDINDISDNRLRTDGQKISGVTNPNAYVTISAKGTVIGSLTSSNNYDTSGKLVYYNALADDNGNFEFTLPDDVTLYVGDEISVYSWRAGKYSTATTTVLDKTPPEVTTKTYYAYVGDTAPAATAFVSAITDKGVTDTSSYPVSYTASTDMATLMQTAGTKQVSLTVSDLAVDSAGLSAPNTTTKTAELIVYDSSTNLSGDSLELSYADIRNMTDSELSTYILSKCNPTAYSVSGGEKTSWSDVNDFTVTDLGSLSGLKDISPNTPYTVTISLPSSVSGLASDITGTISVTVINMNAAITVQFENEAGTILDGYTLTAGEKDTNNIVTPIYVGDTIDLTSTTYAKVQTQLSALETAGYEIVSRPTDETALKITDTTQTVTYTVKGLLFLQSAPTSVDFGSLTYNAKTQRVDNPTTSGKLIITDTRASKTNGWILYAAVTTEMKNTSTGSIMSDAIRYVTNDKKEVTLSSNNQAVYTSTTGGTTDITSDWGKEITVSEQKDITMTGLQLVADPAKTTVSSVGTYSGVITWTIMAGQP
ncbi:pectate lyase-like adhesive domain-containing protein [Enterococcus sp. LJL90]